MAYFPPVVNCGDGKQRWHISLLPIPLARAILIATIQKHITQILIGILDICEVVAVHLRLMIVAPP